MPYLPCAVVTAQNARFSERAGERERGRKGGRESALLAIYGKGASLISTAANNINNTLAFSPCNMPPLLGHT